MADNWSKNRLLYRRNPLAYPAGRAPGFDPSHPAANGMSGANGISVVPTNGNIVDLLTSRIGFLIGAPTGSIKSDLGPSTYFAVGDALDFNGKLAHTPPAITLAAIAQFDSLPAGAYQVIIQCDTAVPNGTLVLNGSGNFGVYLGGDNNSGLFPAANTPYFLAASIKGTVYNFLVMNLRTGAVQTSVYTTGFPIAAVNGTYRVGNNNFAQGMLGPLAAAMYAPTFLSLSQLLVWAKDPWSFWYPRSSLNLVSLEPVPVSTSNFAVFSTPYDDNRTVTQMIGY